MKSTVRICSYIDDSPKMQRRFLQILNDICMDKEKMESVLKYAYIYVQCSYMCSQIQLIGIMLIDILRNGLAVTLMKVTVK